MNLIICHKNNVGVFLTVEVHPVHVELVLIDHYLVNLLVCHQGNVGVAQVGVLLTVEDNPVCAC